MKRSILTLASALLCVAGQGQVTALTQVTTQCEPKPYICFKLPQGATALADTDGKAFDHYALRKASSVSYTPHGSSEAKPMDFFVHIKQDTIVYFAHDMYYLPAKATVSVTVPALTCTAGKTQYSINSTTYTATVADAYTVTSDTKASDIADKLSAGRSLIVVAPSVLTVDADLACKQLIVEGADSVGHFAAGVKVNAGATLAVADTAYYLCHEYDNRGGAYLINHGTYTAASNVFTKNVKQDLNWEYGAKYEHWYNNNPESGVDEPFYDFYPNISLPTSTFNSSIYFSRIGDKSSIYFDAVKPVVKFYNLGNNQQDVYDRPTDRKRLRAFASRTFRINGPVNDFQDVAKSVVASYSPWKSQIAFVNNDYQAPINLRSVVEHADEALLRKATNAYVQQINLQEGSFYNFKTGLTTFDGPMQLGYLLPSMDFASLIDVGSTERLGEFLVSKDDLCSYADMSKKEADVDVQYVRFYLDDANLPKGKGRRSVFVAYFLPSEAVDTLTEGNANFNGEYNKIWEAKMQPLYKPSVPAGGLVMPFVGANGEATLYIIKMYAEPEFEGSVQEYEGTFERIKFFTDPKQKKLEFGILDYKLDNLYVECLNLVVSKNGTKDVVKTTIDLDDAVSSGKIEKTERYDFLEQKAVGYLFNMRVGKNKSNAVAETVAGKTIRIVAKDGGVRFSSAEVCQVSIFDVQGRLLTEKSEVSSCFVPLPSGVYVVSASSSSDVQRKVVIVK